jgi:hypothetical protein
VTRGKRRTVDLLGRVGAVIARVAYGAGAVLASKWAIVAFAIISLTALPQAAGALVTQGNIAPLSAWLSNNFIQLVALAILAFIADQQGRAAEQRSQDMHDKIDALFARAERRDAKHAAALEALHAKLDRAGDA